MVNPDSNHSQSAEAYDMIRQAIIEWELRPGEHITELQLTTMTGFGRASVRAALAQLRHEHLVTVIPRHGYQVAAITFKDVTEVFGVRMVIEPAAARQVAARSDPAVIQQLEAINEQCRMQSGPYISSGYRAASKAFHVALTHATGNERLAQITSTSLDDLQRILYLPQVARDTDRVAATYDEHERIIEAIRQRDPIAAEQATLAHIEMNKTMLIDALLASSEVGSINLVRDDAQTRSDSSAG